MRDMRWLGYIAALTTAAVAGGHCVYLWQRCRERAPRTRRRDIDVSFDEVVSQFPSAREARKGLWRETVGTDAD